jgi:hypothetical protein
MRADSRPSLKVIKQGTRSCMAFANVVGLIIPSNDLHEYKKLLTSA